MSSTRKSQSSQSSILFKFLTKGSQEGPISKANLFNPLTPANQEFSSLFSGFLNSKERRSALFELMKQNGASVEDGNVVFEPDFSSHIDAIVREFLPEKESKPLKKGKGSCCGAAAAVSSCQRIESQSSKHVGGGAVCHKRPNSDPITLAQFQESKSKQENQTCLICANTNNDGSGTCKFKNCGLSHPQNPTSVVVQEQKKSNGTVLVANVCSHFQNGTCKYNDGCRNAHLSKDECAKVLEKNRIHREKKIAGTEVSSEKPKTPAVIVPSQVRLERPSHSSAPSTGLSRVAAELQDSDTFFDKWFDFILERESASVAVSFTPRSYSPAVEVSGSDDEQGDQ
jgi:hypothetical protein